jgi:hypothetical protein
MSIRKTVKGEKPGGRVHFAGDNLRGDKPERAIRLCRKLNNLPESTARFEDQSFRASIPDHAGFKIL